MGGGTWTTASYRSYTTTKCMSVTAEGMICGDYSAQEMFKQRKIAPELNPKNVMRECRDSDEHPNTVPVILSLDVTGSMGMSAVEVAKKLNIVMTSLYEKMSDVEFMIMAIGDLAYDEAPIQISQFESDIRIAEQLDKVYFEGGGGGNSYESYTAAWYMGSRHCDLDCWKRGQNGTIITMGDEPLNPYLPQNILNHVTGDSVQSDIETADLYKEASQKYDIYHLIVNHSWRTEQQSYMLPMQKSYRDYLDENHVRVVTVDDITNAIVDIVSNRSQTISTPSNEISW